jgi:hypothetical protein
MRNVKYLRFWLACALLLLASCGSFHEKFGRAKGKTTISFASGQLSSFTYPPYLGGFVVYVVGVNGNPYSTAKTFPSLAGLAGLNLSVPNGPYQIFGVAWEGPSGTFLQGDSACALGDNGSVIGLNGGSRTITLNFNPSTAGATNFCGYNQGTPFGPNGSSGYGGSPKFNTVNIDYCNGLSGTACSTDYTSWDSTHSVRYTLLSYVKEGVSFGELPDANPLSTCVTSISNGTTNPNIRVPVGGPVGGSPGFTAFKADVFAGGSCSGAPVRTFMFRDGLAAGLSSNPAKSVFSFASGFTSVKVDIN